MAILVKCPNRRCGGSCDLNESERVYAVESDVFHLSTCNGCKRTLKVRTWLHGREVPRTELVATFFGAAEPPSHPCREIRDGHPLARRR